MPKQQQRRAGAGNGQAPQAKPRRTGDQFLRRQAEVVHKAAELFASRGYDATSIGDIADEVGLLKGSLYYYAPSKEEVLYRIIKEVEDAGVKMVETHDGPGGDPLERLRAYIADSVRFVVENRAKTTVAMRDFRALGPEYQAELAPARKATWRFIRERIKQGQELELIRAEVDPTVAAMAIIGAINYLPSWYESGRPPNLARVAAGFASQLVDGVTRRPG